MVKESSSKIPDAGAVSLLTCTRTEEKKESGSLKSWRDEAVCHLSVPGQKLTGLLRRLLGLYIPAVARLWPESPNPALEALFSKWRIGLLS